MPQHLNSIRAAGPPRGPATPIEFKCFRFGAFFHRSFDRSFDDSSFHFRFNFWIDWCSFKIPPKRSKTTPFSIVSAPFSIVSAPFSIVSAPFSIDNGAETKHLNSTRTARPPKGPGSSSRIQMLQSSSPNAAFDRSINRSIDRSLDSLIDRSID